MNIIKVAGPILKENISYNQSNLIESKPSLEPPISTESINDDTVDISNKAKELFAENRNLIFDEYNKSDIEEMLKQLQESSDPSNNPYKDKIKCLQIAMRIINGDKVPNKDKRFLLEKEPGMYANAILLRIKNDKPKKYVSVLEDEKDDSVGKIPETISSASKSPSEEPISSDSIEVSVDLES